jgi:hypothetical protein
MLKGVDLLQHPSGSQDSTLAWGLLLVPAVWLHLHLLWRQITPRRHA